MVNVLTVIWMTALVLLMFAFGALVGLIVARVGRERFERTDPDRRARISKSLLYFAVGEGDPPVVSLRNRSERQTLIETALDTVQIMRGPAKVRLVQHLHEIGLDRLLRRMARRGSVRDRLMAIEGLCFFPGAETLSVLARVEKSKDLRIWLTALRTRAKIGQGPDIFGLLLLAERPGARRSQIMYDLIADRVRANLPEAQRALRTDMPALTRALLVRALGETKTLQALEPLRVALHNADPAVRSAAAGALGQLGFDAAGDALARATRDPDWRVRLKAAESIGQLNLWRQAEHVAPLLEDPVWWVRFRAEEALKRLGELGVRRLSGAPASTRQGRGGRPRARGSSSA